MSIEKGSLAAQLARAGFQETPDQFESVSEQPAPEAGIADLVKQFGNARHQGRMTFSSDKVGIPEEVQIGDIYLCNFPLNKQRRLKSQIRPVIIWGIYRDPKNHVRAVDVVKILSGRGRKNYSDELIVRFDEAAFAGTGNDKTIRIKMDNVYTFPNTSIGNSGYFLDEAGCRSQLNPAIFPDLLLRRVESLLYNGPASWLLKITVPSSWSREGFVFSHINQGNIVNGHRAPEIGFIEGDRPFQINPTVPGNLTQEQVDDIVDWASGRANSMISRGKRVSWPTMGQWPNWPSEYIRSFPVYHHDDRVFTKPFPDA